MAVAEVATAAKEQEINFLELVVYGHGEAFRHFDLLPSNPFEDYQPKVVNEREELLAAYLPAKLTLDVICRGAQMWCEMGARLIEQYQAITPEEVKSDEFVTGLVQILSEVINEAGFKLSDLDILESLKKIKDPHGMKMLEGFARGFTMNPLKGQKSSLFEKPRYIVKEIFPNGEFNEERMHRLTYELCFDFVLKGILFIDANNSPKIRGLSDSYVFLDTVKEYFRFLNTFLTSDSLRNASGIDYEGDFIDLEDPDLIDSFEEVKQVLPYTRAILQRVHLAAEAGNLRLENI
jgi:hypothetical protein